MKNSTGGLLLNIVSKFKSSGVEGSDGEEGEEGESTGACAGTLDVGRLSILDGLQGKNFNRLSDTFVDRTTSHGATSETLEVQSRPTPTAIHIPS